MAEKQMLGLLSGAELRDLVSRGEIDVVWAVTPDQFGRPVGKRFSARHFVDEVLDRQTTLPADLLFRDVDGHVVAPPSTVRVDPGATVGCRPDPSALRRASWLDRTVIAICDVVDPRRDEAHGFSARAALRRQLERSRSASVTPRASYELNFYLDGDRTSGSRHGVDGGSRRGSSALQALRFDGEDDPVLEMQKHARASGVAIDHAAHLGGPGQHTIACRSAGLLEAADRAFILKWLAKEVAAQRSRSVTFMALPDAGRPPSAMEVHMSLWSSDREAALFGGRDSTSSAGDLPMACRWWLGGLLGSARDSTLAFAPTINSYKRFHVDAGRAAAIGWTNGRRGVGFRVEGGGEQRRVTCSIAGADANPYLVGALLLAAGLEGMSSRSDPPAESGTEPAAVRALPRVAQELLEAADVASASAFMRQAIGEQYVEYLAHCARWEHARYGAAVSSWEIERYWDQV